MTPVITVKNLRKTYGAKVAVDDVSFEVRRGEIFGILGPNGAGKTTSVECLTGLRAADDGEIRVLGLDPAHDGAALRERVGVQLQEGELHPKIRVREALELFASFYPDPADGVALATRLGLAEKLDAQYRHLSGGQKQRLAVALALIGKPEIAVLDELTTGLDPQARREVWELVESVREEGVTIVLVTHFMDEAEHLSDRVVVIDAGRVVAEGAPAELAQAATDRRAFRMTTPRPVDLATVRALPEVTDVVQRGREIEVTGTRTVLPAVVLELARHDIVPDDITTLRRSLEDVFLELTGHRSPEGAAA